jgi:hypothetical protein
MSIIPITIDNGRVSVNSASGDIWVTRHEIAELFGVFTGAVTANIKSIFKSGLLDGRRARRVVRHAGGNETTLYNLEMIVALAFRLNSHNAGAFRHWIVGQAVSSSSSSSFILWQVPCMGAMVN